MNRKNLTAAVLAGLAGAAGIVGSAQAVNVNPDGLGQVLIYPYYTVNGGNMTLLSVVNTSEDAKAVKVRFLEGKNSREVLDFNLYMSKYDVWTASIKNVGGTPMLKTADTTCTVPYIYDKNLNGMMDEGDGKQEFLRWGMNDIDLEDDSVFDTIDRAREGHFEMIEMGTLIDEDEGSATAATHVDGVPADCGQLVEAWTDPDNLVPNDEGYWLNAQGMGPFTDMDDPSGGLFGGAAIVNVQKGTMYSYDAKALNGFADSIDAYDVLHTPPGFTTPNLNSGNSNYGYVFLDNGDSYESTWFPGGSVDPVSFVFMHDQMMNEYTTEAVVGGGTEWVMTFPTKHFYVYEEYSETDEPVAPFTSTWDGTGACEVVLLDTIWNREEGSPQDPVITGEPVPPIVSPAPPNEIITPDPIIPFELCFETSVIEFGPGVDGVSGILGSVNLHNIDNTQLGYEYGWARLQLHDYPYDADESGTIDPDEEDLNRMPLGGLEGLPVTGFSVQSFANAFLGDGADVLANYGGIFQHKATRLIGSRVDL